VTFRCESLLMILELYSTFGNVSVEIFNIRKVVMHISDFCGNWMLSANVLLLQVTAIISQRFQSSMNSIKLTFYLSIALKGMFQLMPCSDQHSIFKGGGV
jgi:hypothetical protein